MKLNLKNLHPDHSDTRKDAEHLTEHYFHLAENFYRTPDLPRPTVDFDLTGRSAGQAQYYYNTPARNRISYNFQLLHQNGPSFLARTVPHEVAHIVAILLWGRAARGHGQHWRNVMAAFDIPAATRCHSYDTQHVPRRTQRRHPYHCACQTHNVSTTLQNKMLHGQTRICANCRATLTPGTFTGATER